MFFFTIRKMLDTFFKIRQEAIMFNATYILFAFTKSIKNKVYWKDYAFSYR